VTHEGASQPRNPPLVAADIDCRINKAKKNAMTKKIVLGFEC